MADTCKDDKDAHPNASMQARGIIYMNEERKELRSVRFIFNQHKQPPRAYFLSLWGLFVSVCHTFITKAAIERPLQYGG